MLNKIIFNDIRKTLKEYGFSMGQLSENADYDIYYKINNWDGGYESSNGYNGSREEFYSNQNEMFKFLQALIIKLDIKKCIISPLIGCNYFEKWSDIKGNDIYLEIVKILSSVNIKQNSKSGVVIDALEDFWIIKRFAEGGFRFISHAFLVFPEKGLIIQPHHHMNLLTYLSCKDAADIMLELLNTNEELAY